MHKILIIKAFEKARNELIKQGIQNPSNVKIAEEISDSTEKIEGLSLGERSYRDYYNEALEIEEDKLRDIDIKQIKVVNGLCKYLGFNNYAAFETNIKSKKTNSINLLIKSVFQKYKLPIILFSLVIAFFIYNSINKQKWMVWNEDHYIEADFNSKSLNLGELKLYNIDRIENFRKIDPNCETVFFKNDGTEMIWYGKNKAGELEFFTSVGLHPETGNTLKKITKHIIKKYICDSY